MAGGQERQLRRRIRSVQSTRKITRAMELIAASRIVRAQQAILAARPYVEQMRHVVGDLADTPDARDHPLFRDTERSGKVGLIAIAGDRGLSGAYNSSIFRAAEQVIANRSRAGRDTLLVAVGRKVDGHFRYRNRPAAASITGVSDRPTFGDAQRVVHAVTEPFDAGEVDEIVLVYTTFASMATQRVTIRRLVPLSRDGDAAPGRQSGSRPAATSGQARPGGQGAVAGAQDGERQTVDFEYEPEPGAIMDRLLPRWLEAEVFAALLEAAASEHAARQRAMKAATDNADDLIKTLTRVMNRARQDAITTEIMEIVGGAEALRQGAEERFNEIYVPATEQGA
jgi:F-type H+-transporting ATPase subunit gamma